MTLGYTFGTRQRVALSMPPCRVRRQPDHPVALTPDENHFADEDNLGHALLQALHPTGYRDLRAFRTGDPPMALSVDATNLAGADAFADRYHDRNVFVGVAPRANATARATDACFPLRALFADIDFKDFKDPAEAEARARLAEFPLAPSAVIASGGGLQCYWLLTDPLDIAQAKPILRALATAIGADLSAAEPARVLRLPGTRNYKYSPPRDVVVETCEVSRRYTVEELRAVLPTETKPKTLPLPPSIPHKQRHTTLFREGCRLRRLGWETAEIADALWSVHQHRSEGPEVPRANIDKIAADICKRYAPTADPFHFSEAGDAEHFADLHQDDVRYDHRQGRWLILADSGIWLPDRTGIITTLALEAVRMRQALALTITDSDRRQKALAWTWKGEHRARLTNLLALTQDLPPVADAGDDWDRIPYLLGTPDGVIDLRTRTLRPASPAERVTMRTSATYDPDAASALWSRVLAEIFPDETERWWMQTALGYSITGSVNLDKWFLPYGEKGRNGKGTIFGAVASALGDYAMEIDAATFDKRQTTPYNVAQLPGRRFVHCSEAGNTTTLNHERVKQVTGGDTVRAADKYQRSFEFHPACKLWFACNDRPKVSKRLDPLRRLRRRSPSRELSRLMPATVLRRADCHVCSCARVFATKCRLTALLLVPRLSTPAGSGSRLRSYCRVDTPTSICSTTRRVSGSVPASVRNVGNGTSRPSARTRGRCCRYRRQRFGTLRLSLEIVSVGQCSLGRKLSGVGNERSTTRDP